MKYKYIPETELQSSAICLGGAPLGSSIDQGLSFKLMDLFHDAGGNFIDTANVYADWLPVEKSISEKTIGKWLKERGNRNKILIGTKGGHPDLASMHISRLSRDEVIHDLEESLKSLQTDYIDIYWLHRDDEKRPVADILEYLNELVQTGKIRYFGCSNWKLPRIREAVQYAAERKMKCFVGNQSMWSFAVPNTEAIEDKTLVVMDQETIEFHKETKMAAIPYSSQANGFFTKLDNANKLPLSDGFVKKYYNSTNIERFERIKKLAAYMSLSIGEVVLGYLTSQPFVTIPVVGCRTAGQLSESLKAGDLAFDSNILDYLGNGI